MIIWLIVFVIVSALCMIMAYTWKGASKEAKKGLLKHLQMFAATSTVLLVILCVIVSLF